MNLTLKIWRQAGPKAKGEMVTYPVTDISPDMSFLEMLDVLNEQLNARGEEPIAFDSDCREGICGMCGLMISGKAHGPEVTTTCQLHMRSFSDGDEITIEPWRADAFPVIKDLVVDRSAFDRIIQAGGFISANTGAAPEAHSVPVPKPKADRAFMAAACIGCGACVAACPNASGMLFMGAKITHLGELPQGQPERDARVVSMVSQHDAEGFGGCTNIGECSLACPKEIPMDVINQLNRDLRHALVHREVL
jgi:succinate dehydrogenase / fumarate reductase iron-sulfur subunit